MRRRQHLLVGVLALAPACAAAQASLAPLVGAEAAPPAPWHVAGLPNQSKPYTRFQPTELDGQRVLRVEAERSYGYLVHPLPAAARGTLSWRWRVDLDNEHSDLRRKSGDDNALEVCAAFDLPLAAVPFVERQLLRAARLRSREPLPAASVCYVWDRHLPTGTVLDNVYTRRVRTIVLRGSGSALQAWTSETRDLRADFLRLFGDESAEVPPLIGVSVGADADNTQQRSLAFVAGLQLQP